VPVGIQYRQKASRHWQRRILELPATFVVSEVANTSPILRQEGYLPRSCRHAPPQPLAVAEESHEMVERLRAVTWRSGPPRAERSSHNPPAAISTRYIWMARNRNGVGFDIARFESAADP
jgi:hypothetical protein